MVVAGDRLLAIAYERAIHGTVQPVWHKGEIVGEARKPSGQLLVFLLTHMDRMRFGEPGDLHPHPITDPRHDARCLIHHFTDARA